MKKRKRCDKKRYKYRVTEMGEMPHTMYPIQEKTKISFGRKCHL